MKQEENRIVYGKNAVTELFKSGVGVDTVYLAEGMAPAVASYYMALARDCGAVVKRVHTAKTARAVRHRIPSGGSGVCQ